MFKVRKLLMLLPLLVLVFASCGHYDKQADAARRKELATIDSLIGIRGDSTLMLIKKGMKTAPDSMTRYEFYARLATYYRLSATPDSLVPILEEVEKFASQDSQCERSRQLLAYAYNCHAGYYHNFHLNVSQTIALYQKSYELLMASEDKSQAPKVVANLGDAYAFENNLPKAAQCYRRALFLVDSLKLPARDNVTLYLGFAGICQQLGDNDNALKYYKQTDEQRKEMSVGMQAYFLNNFGSYYYYLKDYNNALQKFEALRSLLEKNGMQNNFDMFLCKINLADVYLNLNRLDEAKECLDAVEPFAVKNGEPAMLYYCRTIRIGIAVKEKKWDDVKQLLKDEKIDGSIPFQLTHIRNSYLCDYYTATGNYAQAYKDRVADEALDDSLEHNRTNMRTADIMVQFTADTLRLHSDLALEHQKSISRQTGLVSIIAIILAIAFGLLLMVVRLRGKKRHSDAIVKIMDLRLANARSRFSPHFVFNVINNYIITTGGGSSNKDMLLKLTKYIRSGLDISRKLLTSLDEEVEHVNNYVSLEKPMAGEDFEFDLKVEDDIDLTDTYVPSMFIQLMVENAFVHGLNGWDGHKVLKLYITRVPRGIQVQVTDNGPGFRPVNMAKKRGHGLDIIRQTMAVMNTRIKQKIKFDISNVQAPDGHVAGCQMTLTVPEKLKYLIDNKNSKPTL